MAIQVNNTVDTTAVRVCEHDYLAIFDAKVGKQILLSRQIPNQKILRLISLSRKFLGLYVGKGQICKLLNVSDSSAFFWPVHGIIGSANPQIATFAEACKSYKLGMWYCVTYFETTHLCFDRFVMRGWAVLLIRIQSV